MQRIAHPCASSVKLASQVRLTRGYLRSLRNCPHPQMIKPVFSHQEGSGYSCHSCPRKTSDAQQRLVILTCVIGKCECILLDLTPDIENIKHRDPSITAHDQSSNCSCACAGMDADLKLGLRLSGCCFNFESLTPNKKQNGAFNASPTNQEVFLFLRASDLAPGFPGSSSEFKRS